MRIDLTDTNASQVASALLQARRRAGSPAMGMVLTLVVVTDEANHGESLRAARTVSTEHPSRILGVIRGQARGGRDSTRRCRSVTARPARPCCCGCPAS